MDQADHYTIILYIRLYTRSSWSKTVPPISFSPVTSTNVRISPKNFLTFDFDPFATIMQYFKAIPSASRKLLNLNQELVFSGQILIKLML